MLVACAEADTPIGQRASGAAAGTRNPGMDLCLIGRITKAHGVNGAVGVESFSDNPGRFSALPSVLVGDAVEHVTNMTVVQARESARGVILQFEGIRDRNQAQALVGKRIYISADRMLPPPEGAHYIHDLIGCAVFDGEGARKGTIVDVVRLPAHDAYVVSTGGRDAMIPAVPAFIVSVDVAGKQVFVNDIPGLFDDAD